jgi:hypothetical protein
MTTSGIVGPEDLTTSFLLKSHNPSSQAVRFAQTFLNVIDLSVAHLLYEAGLEGGTIPTGERYLITGDREGRYSIQGIVEILEVRKVQIWKSNLSLSFSTLRLARSFVLQRQIRSLTSCHISLKLS